MRYDTGMKIRKVDAELLGSAVLVMTVIGSGEMAQSLSSDFALQLLINALCTSAILYLLITLLGASWHRLGEFNI
jgi:glycerol uptake facilitator-like aquaporin